MNLSNRLQKLETISKAICKDDKAILRDKIGYMAQDERETRLAELMSKYIDMDLCEYNNLPESEKEQLKAMVLSDLKKKRR